jgi:hypothetical protein
MQCSLGTGQTTSFFCFPCNLGFRSYPQSDVPLHSFKSSISLLPFYLRLCLLNVVLPFVFQLTFSVCLLFSTCTVHLVISSLFSWSILTLSSCCLGLCIPPPPPPSNFRMPEPVCMKFGFYTMAPGPLRTAYFINPSHLFVCLYAYRSVSVLGNGSTNTFLRQERIVEGVVF